MTQRARHARLATRGVTFDTSVLIALERRKASALALLRACRLARARITIPAAVVMEWWRGRHAAVLESCDIEPLTAALAQTAGDLLAKTGRSNAIDASVVATAALRGDLIVTGDPEDLRELAQHVRGVTIARLGA